MDDIDLRQEFVKAGLSQVGGGGKFKDSFFKRLYADLDKVAEAASGKSVTAKAVNQLLDNAKQLEVSEEQAAVVGDANVDDPSTGSSDDSTKKGTVAGGLAKAVRR